MECSVRKREMQSLGQIPIRVGGIFDLDLSLPEA